ncbi:arsenite methyltransferase-like [Haliotis rufescens]|uniref:arsenite methyltransferase-like n=1 Tax=Haliotis rufescens TaxID=6454 RepID=UPI00201E9E3B|nr:arsenite methyltransferase-like [Haliotis rufescens]XP_046357449.2 arsenite methyltransferase-like [Haliotis rufescens]XP_046357450.2 arsenite methyltransferase-like [Haliotis rufescens]XP_046357451.2 arsenite methyltransferase-like [Haliotis rufescens]XP_046357452.2 arsenite methyltransferase-like [Haliotis rufescens]XP_046357453.2 arsenite methyltransferase-like [Haliotis rufescens]XP_046357454.2 arsenite methyltransferase-like [Haliotis rufescens]XP_046357455.2 arsenite methyltransfera
MADQAARDFYNETSVKLTFVCGVNDWDFTPAIKDIVAKLHPETMKRYYGSGFIVPGQLEGLRILDIGCGSGSLVFILSKLVGPTGRVVGVDFAENLIAESKAREDFHREAWGYEKANTEFFIGNAENLSTLEDNTFDVIVSNGVVCMITDKNKVFAEAFRLLKDGGELYLSDVYASQRAPPELMDDKVCWVFGLTGSQVREEFHASARAAGFTTPVLTGVGPVCLSPDYQEKLPGSRYCCARNRMFRLPPSGKRGPAKVTYKGSEEEFKWDISLTFKSGEPVSVDGELATILTNSRYGSLFDVADSADTAVTKRGQCPFDFLDQLTGQGVTLPYVYTVA